MTTTSPNTTDLSEHATGNEDQDLTSTPGTMTQATLVPTADNMNMEHIFFSIKHLEARITQLEQNNAQMEDNGINPTRLQELGLMTRAEHDQEIRQLWKTIHTLQSAHQGLNAQFERGDRLCRDRMREVMFDPSFTKKRINQLVSNMIGVLSLAPAMQQGNQQICFPWRSKLVWCETELHTTPIVRCGVGARLIHQASK